MTPLAHLGYYERVDRADYDPIIAQAGIRELVGALPRGEADYLDALRAYTGALYAPLLEASGAERLLDKTPAYSLVLDFLAKLYPNARYVVLTRNPFAIWASFVESFFDGDHEVAHAHNPILERYVPAIARFLRERPVPVCPVGYEALVADPESEVARICEFLELPFEPSMIDYGRGEAAQGEVTRGLGDPITVAKHTRPTTDSLSRWIGDWAGEARKVEQAEDILARLADEDLETWGFQRDALRGELAAVDLAGKSRRRRPLTRYTLERKLAVALRRNIHQNALGRLVRRIRYACDVLLR
jgi:hypothetical protein